MKLRDYQRKCLNNIRTAVASNGRALVNLCVGSGKTVIFSELTRRAYESGKSVLIIVNKIVLAEQSGEMLKKFNVPYTYFSAGMKEKKYSQVTIASIATWKNAPKDFDITIIDEVHRHDPSQFNGIVIGFTGTPFNNREYIYGEGKFFNKPCIELTIKDMTPKYLVPLMQSPQDKRSRIDLSGVKKAGGDFVQKHLSESLLSNKRKIDAQIEDAYAKSANYKKIVVLSVSIEHAEYIFSKLDDAAIIHSKRKDRKYQFDKFKNDEDTRILVSVLIASEGFDYPKADCIWFMRPTRSPVLYIQGVGRVLRKSEGKEHALMLDYGEIVENLGLVYDAHKSIGNKKKKNETKLCPFCSSFNDISAKECEWCGEEFLTICSVCGNSKRYGEKCCEIKVDRYKNLTISETNETEEICDSIQVGVKEGRNGYPYVMITYYKGLRKFCTEVLSYSPKSAWAMNRFRSVNNIKISSTMPPQVLKKIILKSYHPMTIRRKKSGIYWNRDY